MSNTTVFSPPIGDVVLPIDSAGNAALANVTVSGNLSGAGVTAATGAAVTKAAVSTALLTGASTFVLNGATPVTVAAAAITANSQVLITLKTVGGSVGAQPHVLTITPGTGFSVVGTASDTSTYNYMVIG